MPTLAQKQQLILSLINSPDVETIEAKTPRCISNMSQQDLHLYIQDIMSKKTQSIKYLVADYSTFKKCKPYGTGDNRSSMLIRFYEKCHTKDDFSYWHQLSRLKYLIAIEKKMISLMSTTFECQNIV